ncbi:hypothetical protein BH09BAC1_BH09BAC1_04660 [soil metagenome]
MNLRLIARSVVVLTLILLTSACGSWQPWYADKYKGWETQLPPSEKPIYSFFLIGDAGKPNFILPEAALTLLNTHLLKADKNSMVIFLGDNIYEEGMPAINHMHRLRQENRINESIKAVEGYKGTVLFIPGNHDWYAATDSQPDGLFYEREYLYEKLGSENVFLPKDGKPGPAVLEVNDSVVLVVLDSYRWVRDLPKPVKRKSKYLSQPVPEFQEELKHVLATHSGKRIVMVAHHPLFTNGGHGGFVPFREHIFPLLVIRRNLWIPLPVLGSIVPLGRKFGAIIEDVKHKRYKQYIRVILDATKDNKDLVYAAGHEHSLQLFEKHQKHFIVSGAGTKSSWVRKRKGAAFTHISVGFCKLDIYANGEMWVTYIEPKEGGDEEIISFRWKLAGAK